MVNFDLNKDTKLSEEEKDLLAEAKKRPIVYDEDSPELTDEMEKAFIDARKEKPCQGEPLTIYVSKETILKVKNMGADYIAILGKLLDKAVSEYRI